MKTGMRVIYKPSPIVLKRRDENSMQPPDEKVSENSALPCQPPFIETNNNSTFLQQPRASDFQLTAGFCSDLTLQVVGTKQRLLDLK